MVRQEERPWQGQGTVLLDLRAGAHVTGVVDREKASAAIDARWLSSLEWAVSAAASISHHLMLAGRDVGLLAEATETERMRPGTPERLLDYLAGVTPTARPDLS